MAEKPVTFEDLVGDVPESATDAPVAEKPRKRAGRPAYVEPKDFTEALMALTPPQAAFVRGVLSGMSQADAYKSGHPTANLNTARSNGKRLAQSKAVQAALKLGRIELAAETRVACRFAIEDAHRQIQNHVQGAIDAGQWNAVASMDRELLKLHKLTESKENVAVSGFSIVIHQADGTTKIVGADET